MMAGTLLLLGDAGWELHYMNLSTGNLGSTDDDAGADGAGAAARGAGRARRCSAPTWHPPICNDLEIFYDDRTLRRLGAVDPGGGARRRS